MLKHALKPFSNQDITRALANLCWITGERLSQMVVAIFVSGLLARYFGPATFGKWQYANALLATLTPLTWLCGIEILLPMLVQPRGRTLGTLIGSAFVLRLAAAFGVLFISWVVLASSAIDPLVRLMLAGLTVTIIFREPFAVINIWLQSLTHNRPALLISTSAAVLKVILVFILVRQAMAPSYFGWLWALEAALIATALMIYFARANGGQINWHIDRKLLRHFASVGFIFWLGIICMYLFLKLDRLMLEKYLSYTELGRYAAAQQLNENWLIFGTMLAQTLAPAFIYRIETLTQLHRNLLRLVTSVALFMAVCAAILSFLSPLIVRLIFGPNYMQATDFLQWSVWLSVPASVEAITNLLVLKNQAKFVLLTKWAVALAVAFMVNYLLIPQYGGYGALLGLASGYLAAVAVNIYYIAHHFKRAPKALSDSSI